MSTSRAVSEVNRAVNEALRWDRAAQQFQILRFGRHREGYLQAQVTVSGSEPIYVHRRSGSWMIPREPQSEAVTAQFGARTQLQVLEPFSYQLADAALKFEKAEREALRVHLAAEEAAAAAREEVEAHANDAGDPVPAAA
jgi:hypothetical protein